MPDYKEMYLTLFRATEQAVSTLVAAQRACEELYISQPDGEVKLLPPKEKQPPGAVETEEEQVEGETASVP